MVSLERSAYFARRVEAGDYSAKTSPASSASSTPTAATAASSSLRSALNEAKRPMNMLHSHGASESQVTSLEPAFFEKFGGLASALRSFSSTLPVLTEADLEMDVPDEDAMEVDVDLNDIDTAGEEPGPPGTIPRAHSSRTHTLIFGHSMAHGSLVQLYAILAEHDCRARRRMVESALKLTEVMHLVRNLEMEYFQILLVVSLSFSLT